MTSADRTPHDENALTPFDTRYLFVLPFSTDPALARRFLDRDQDLVGNIRFGKLLETLDKVAENTALAYVNRINFNQPVLLGDQLKFTARVVYTGSTTITVQSDIERSGRVGCDKALSNSCLFTFRNVDTEMQPRQVPAIYPVTYAEDARYLSAYRQRID